MASADEYFANAELCIALASRASDPGDKARLLQMAQAWRNLVAKLVETQIQDKSTGVDHSPRS
jgi:hypothetical protein